ncbi:MAG: PAS domain-containing protein [Planctomycetes bacterium]|nr:PAS domain-containing protein [Planctomycetota bacterium]
MPPKKPQVPSSWRDELALRWGFLEEEKEPCAVVSHRMELVFINAAGRALLPEEWFGKRCFEVLPTVDEKCALHCPTIRAVNESVEPVYCEEVVQGKARTPFEFGVAVIPLAAAPGQDPAKAVLLFRQKKLQIGETTFQTQLLEDAAALRKRLAAKSS